jgi:hypothetical protein
MQALSTQLLYPAEEFARARYIEAANINPDRIDSRPNTQ